MANPPGFAKGTLRPGERRTVPVSRRPVSYWGESGNRWVTIVGQVPVHIGRSRRGA
ncbi:fibronectin type III-like domain-contianing protein [Streptomyces sp. NPDC085596]|uniref:fibronectin type III-like domain-contianing protein n=1 Tax=Streptomyces TaxID=1883 RepID=UPI0037CED866